MVMVPCGHCLGCRGEQSRQWAVRMMHEKQMHALSWFTTLTYSEEELPKNGSLRPKDFSGFIKDLRKRYPPRSISYYGCGEYGEDTQRPHYHAVLFGPQFLDRYSHPDITRSGIWKSEDLEASWRRGISELGTLTMASASYVSGYVRKKVRQKNFDRINPFTGELLEPEFGRMSLRPAIGKRWIEKYWTDVYPRDFVVIDGIEAKPPRYYDKWMDENQPDIMQSVRETRWDECIQLEDRELRAREAEHTARVNLFQARKAI